MVPKKRKVLNVNLLSPGLNGKAIRENMQTGLAACATGNISPTTCRQSG